MSKPELLFENVANDREEVWHVVGRADKGLDGDNGFIVACCGDLGWVDEVGFGYNHSVITRRRLDSGELAVIRLQGFNVPEDW